MQGISGVGAIFSKIAPSVNAGIVPGEWQVYDLTLVDRHVTVVLNAVKVIDNQPVNGPTGGAIHTDPAAPGLRTRRFDFADRILGDRRIDFIERSLQIRPTN